MNHDKLFDLTDRAAIVTGASSGLGRRFALVLARAGAKVAIAARRTDKLIELAKEIEAFDGRAVPIALDVTDATSVHAAVAAAETEIGPIAILVNNAGVGLGKRFLDDSEADWNVVLDTNLKGAWLMGQEVARHMVRLGHGGSIVNIASMLGLIVARQSTLYCAAKAGLVHATKAMALELARHNIRVNAICPGYFDSEMTHDFLASEAGQRMIGRTPFRRAGTEGELDGALLLLAGDAGSYITGTTLVVDGGHSLVNT